MSQESEDRRQMIDPAGVCAHAVVMRVVADDQSRYENER